MKNAFVVTKLSHQFDRIDQLRQFHSLVVKCCSCLLQDTLKWSIWGKPFIYYKIPAFFFLNTFFLFNQKRFFFKHKSFSSLRKKLLFHHRMGFCSISYLWKSHVTSKHREDPLFEWKNSSTTVWAYSFFYIGMDLL